MVRMDRPEFPVLACAPVLRASNTSFNLPDEVVRIDLPRSQVSALLELCDGRRSVRAIASALRARMGVDVEDIVRALLDAGALVDSNDAGRAMWRYVAHGNVDDVSEGLVAALTQDESLQDPPGRLTHVIGVPASRWRTQLARRRSTRAFTPARLSEADLSILLWSAYGAVPRGSEPPRRRTVPSGGALYPLVLHLVLFEPAGKVKPGTYRITSRRPYEIELTLEGGLPPAGSMIFDPRPAEGANGLVAISGSFARGRPKYGSRSLLLTLVEAGHAAENLHLAALERHLTSLEVVARGDGMHASLRLERDWVPFVAVLFGAEAKQKKTSSIVRIESLPRRIGTFKLPNVCVVIQDELRRSMGMARTRAIAERKARAESAERMAFEQSRRRELVRASFVELGARAVDPRHVVLYAKDQIKSHRSFKPFDPRATYEWFEVRVFPSGEPRLVLADCICPPRGAGAYTSCSSSGAAAHLTKARAVQGGLLELVERDAFMVTWLNRLARPRIRADTLPAELARRVRAIEAEGYAVRVIDMTLDLSPAALLVLSHPGAPLLACATAASFTREAAIEHALGEAENIVYWHLQEGLGSIVAPEEVESVMHHGALYKEPANIRHASFLTRGRETTLRDAERRGGANSFDALLEVLARQGREVLVADLRKGNPDVERTAFEVVKVLVPGLVPMSFGWNNEPLGMRRIRDVLRACGLRGSARLNRFPHPLA
jgi:ribosomal protein S12 methylthiotransferase accessory factor